MPKRRSPSARYCSGVSSTGVRVAFYVDHPDTTPDPAPTAGAVEADPGSSTAPGADAAAAAEAVREADTNQTETQE